MSGINDLFRRSQRAPTHGPSQDVLATVVVTVVEVLPDSVTLSVGPPGTKRVEVTLAEDETMFFKLSAYRFDG